MLIRPNNRFACRTVYMWLATLQNASCVSAHSTSHHTSNANAATRIMFSASTATRSPPTTSAMNAIAVSTDGITVTRRCSRTKDAPIRNTTSAPMV